MRHVHRALTLASFTVVVLSACDKPAPAPGAQPEGIRAEGAQVEGARLGSDAEVSEWTDQLEKLELARQQQARRLEATGEQSSLVPLIRRGLTEERRLQVQARKAIGTVKELVQNSADPVAARADAKRRVTAAVEAAAAARADNERLWVRLQSELTAVPAPTAGSEEPPSAEK